MEWPKLTKTNRKINHPSISQNFMDLTKEENNHAFGLNLF